jgi:hypothetical protein
LAKYCNTNTFEEAEEEDILEGRLLDVLPHPTRPNQQIFIIRLHGYAHAVPFVTDKDDNISLKTIYPGRDFQKQYEGTE